MRKILFSFAAFESISKLSPFGISSAYSGKYFVPYGELKHSGSVTSSAPNDVMVSSLGDFKSAYPVV